jgi:hypothetical protein
MRRSELLGQCSRAVAHDHSDEYFRSSVHSVINVDFTHKGRKPASNARIGSAPSLPGVNFELLLFARAAEIKHCAD